MSQQHTAPLEAAAIVLGIALLASIASLLVHISVQNLQINSSSEERFVGARRGCHSIYAAFQLAHAVGGACEVESADVKSCAE